MSSCRRHVMRGERVEWTRSAVPGLLKSAHQETPWLVWGHVDLAGRSIESDADLAFAELRSREKNYEIEWRDGCRRAPVLQPVDFSTENKGRSLPFQNGGLYLLTGGLGGVGPLVAKYLLDVYHARLLITGRTLLPESRNHREGGPENSGIDEKVRAYEELQRSGAVVYEAVDVCDAEG